MAQIGPLIIVLLLIGVGGFLWLLQRRSAGQENFYTPSVIPMVPAQSDSSFRLTIEDTFEIRGRGLVVTGKVESGSLGVGQSVQIASPDGSEHYVTQVTGLEAFHRMMTQAQTGDNIGVLLKGLTRDQIKRGMIMTQQP